ncbi:Phage protein [Bacillus mycoides]|uniref:DUF3942 family protein n=1 Tax=Bacillus mycoides TaxID=1405 RepID=UPI0007AB7F63|nr:DUF3942 family protein [Bacillus mycoides]KZE06299.1 Phage protein [Bacillus mycoides]
MNGLDQFIEKVKTVVATDAEEKLLREQYNQVILPGMKKIKEDLNKIEGFNYSVSVSEGHSDLKIRDKEFTIRVDAVTNTIKIYTITDPTNYVDVDKIILKEEKLFSTERDEIFTEEILVVYLNEVFKEILG